MDHLITHLREKFHVGDELRWSFEKGDTTNQVKVSIEVFSTSNMLKGEFVFSLDNGSSKAKPKVNELHLENSKVPSSDLLPLFRNFTGNNRKRTGRTHEKGNEPSISESLKQLFTDEAESISSEMILVLFMKMNNEIKSLKNDIQQLQRNTVEKEVVFDYLDIEGVMKILGLKKSTIYSKVNRKEIPYMKRGKRLYFSRVDIEKYLLEGRNMDDHEVEQKALEYMNSKLKP